MANSGLLQISNNQFLLGLLGPLIKPQGARFEGGGVSDCGAYAQVLGVAVRHRQETLMRFALISNLLFLKENIFLFKK